MTADGAAAIGVVDIAGRAAAAAGVVVAGRAAVLLWSLLLVQFLLFEGFLHKSLILLQNVTLSHIIAFGIFSKQ